MKFLLFFLFSILSFNSVQSSSYTSSSRIEIEIETLDNEDRIRKSSSFGEKLIEYNGYRLFDVLSFITEKPKQYFVFEGEIDNPIVKFEAKSSDKILKNELIESLFDVLKNKLKISITFFEEMDSVKIIYSTDITNKKMFSCPDDYYESSIKIINRTLKARCVTNEQFVQQISEWYGIDLINKLSSSGKYNFELHHSNSLEEFIMELNYFYSIDIKEEEMLVKKMLVKKI